MGARATQVMNVAKRGNFWIGLVSGGAGSAVAFALFFIGIGQKLQAQTNAVDNVTASSTANTNAITKLNEKEEGKQKEISAIKQDVAVIKQVQTAQKEDIKEIKDQQKEQSKRQMEQTQMLQKILLELKK